MGVITLSELRGELAFLFDNRADSGFSAPRLNRWVNAAYTHMCHPSVHRFREMQTTYTITLATGVNEYALDSTTVGFQIVAVRNATHYQALAVSATARQRKLYPKSYSWFDGRTLPSAQPSNYGIDGTTLLLSGVPTAAENGQRVRLRVYREPALLSADGDATVLPVYYDRVLLLGALWCGEFDLGYRDRAELTKGDYAGLLNDPKDRMELEAEDTGWEVEISGSEERMYP